MADPSLNRPSATGRRQSSRLQSRAPSSLQINRAVDWNVAIPLLSPLASSPPPPPPELRPADQRDEMLPTPPPAPPQRRQSVEQAKMAFKKWQQAPFCYEHASVVPPFR